MTITASNGIGSDSNVGIVITVNQPPGFTVGTTGTLNLGITGSTFTFTTTGFPAPTFSITGGTLPPGLNLDPTTGILSGTTAPGTYTFTVTASNGIGSDANLTFTLSVVQPPSITTADTVTWQQGTTNSFPVASTGFPTPALTESGTLPTGLTYTQDPAGNTGVLDGTTALAAGTYTFSFTASNGVTPDATQSFTLVVAGPVAITSVSTTTFQVGQAGTFQVATTGTPVPSIAEVGALPTGVTFNVQTGTLSGTPTQGTGKLYPITFIASNGGSPVSQSFNLLVDEAPVFINSSTTGTFLVGQPLPALSFAVTGYPIPKLGEVGALPAGVTFDAAKGTLVGTPTQTGIFAIAITADNGIGQLVSQGFVLSVVSATSPPASGGGSNSGGSGGGGRSRGPRSSS